MKKIHTAIAAALAMITISVQAQSTPNVQEVTRNVIKSAKSYVAAVACTELQQIEPRHVAALAPYKSTDDRLDARFAVLWTGDIGCAGGSATESTNIAIVQIGAGDSYYVDPKQSSPVVEFASPVRYIERLVGNTKDTLILEGKEYGPKDANCCPSIAVRFTLKADQAGNWKLSEKKVLPAKK